MKHPGSSFIEQHPRPRLLGFTGKGRTSVPRKPVPNGLWREGQDTLPQFDAQSLQRLTPSTVFRLCHVHYPRELQLRNSLCHYRQSPCKTALLRGFAAPGRRSRSGPEALGAFSGAENPVRGADLPRVALQTQPRKLVLCSKSPS